jgi:hypothetical protein
VTVRKPVSQLVGQLFNQPLTLFLPVNQSSGTMGTNKIPHPPPISEINETHSWRISDFFFLFHTQREFIMGAANDSFSLQTGKKSGHDWANSWADGTSSSVPDLDNFEI